MRKRTDGFTLVELMVVVLIIGILVAIAVPVFNSAKANAAKNTCFANQRMVEGLYQQCASAGNPVPDSQYTYASWFVTQGYLKAEPQCPSLAPFSKETGRAHHYCFIDYYGQGNVRMFLESSPGSQYGSSSYGCLGTGLAPDVVGHNHYTGL